MAPELIPCDNANNTIEKFLARVDQQSTIFDFNDKLHNIGQYDLIYIDNTYGTDDIRRNAKLFEQVVRWVNSEKSIVGSTEKNVVIGESMGGLVARYGLAEMTRMAPNVVNGVNTNDPDTRLLILQDSPQRGAYNPLGVQSLTRSFDVPIIGSTTAADMNDKLTAAVRILDEPATAQLSILNAYNGRGTDIRGNTFIPNIYRPMVDFGPSDPVQPTYAVIANSVGSQCGHAQYVPPGQLLSNTTGSFGLSPLVSLLPVSLVVSAQTRGLPAYGQPGTISYADISIQYNLCFQLAFVRICIPVRFRLLHESAGAPANTLPYETLPGGSEPVDGIGSCNDPGAPPLSLYRSLQTVLTTRLYHGDICFVPTYSALDVATVTPTTATAAYIYGAPSLPNAIPKVQPFIAQANVGNTAGSYNLTHLAYTARSSEWIFNEMQNQQQLNIRLNCQSECNPYPVVPITGPDIVCANGSATLTVAPPFGGVTDWTVSPAGLATFTTPTAGATSVTLVPASGATGVVTLTAYLSNGCFSTTATRQVGIGPPETELVGPTSISCGDPQEEYSITPFFRSQRYSNLAVTGWASIKPLAYATSGTFAIVFRGTGPVHITMDVESDCVPKHEVSLDVTVENNCGRSAAALYPNPARETVDVHIENADAARPVTVRLFDSYGRARAEQTSTGTTSVRLATGKLPAGLYYVHILRGQQVLSRQQLRIEK